MDVGILYIRPETAEKIFRHGVFDKANLEDSFKSRVANEGMYLALAQTRDPEIKEGEGEPYGLTLYAIPGNARSDDIDRSNFLKNAVFLSEVARPDKQKAVFSGGISIAEAEDHAIVMCGYTRLEHSLDVDFHHELCAVQGTDIADHQTMRIHLPPAPQHLSKEQNLTDPKFGLRFLCQGFRDPAIYVDEPDSITILDVRRHNSLATKGWLSAYNNMAVSINDLPDGDAIISEFEVREPLDFNKTTIEGKLKRDIRPPKAMEGELPRRYTIKEDHGDFKKGDTVVSYCEHQPEHYKTRLHHRGAIINDFDNRYNRMPGRVQGANPYQPYMDMSSTVHLVATDEEKEKSSLLITDKQHTPHPPRQTGDHTPAGETRVQLRGANTFVDSDGQLVSNTSISECTNPPGEYQAVLRDTGIKVEEKGRIFPMNWVRGLRFPQKDTNNSLFDDIGEPTYEHGAKAGKNRHIFRPTAPTNEPDTKAPSCLAPLPDSVPSQDTPAHSGFKAGVKKCLKWFKKPFSSKGTNTEENKTDGRYVHKIREVPSYRGNIRS